MLKNNKNWLIISLVSLILVGIAGFLKKRAEVSISAYIGILFLVLTLIPKNLALLLPAGWQKPFQAVGKYKRDFGITAGLLFLTHALLAWNIFGKLKPEFLVRGEIILGLIALIIFIALLLTSSKWSIRILKKNWKRLHILVWAAVPLAFLHSSIAALHFTNEMSIIAVVGFGSLYLLAFAQIFIKKWQHFALILVSWILGIILLSVAYPSVLADFNKNISERNNPKPSSTAITPSPEDTTATSSNIEKTVIPSVPVTPATPATPVTSEPTAKPAQTTTKTLSLTELSSNNTASKCWVSFEKKVYNVTNYLGEHPGGRRELLRVCGKEIDNLSSGHPGGSFNSSEVQGILKEFFVGNLG